MKNIIYLILLLTFGSINAQVFGNDPEIKIENIAPNNAWQIVEMALTENNFAVGEFKYSEGLLLSNWISWKALMISNRARLYFEQDATTLTLKIADRNYKTDKDWAEAIGKLSKKKYKVYVQSVADKINEINSNPDLIRKAVKMSKLIPAFNPIQTIEPVEWKLIAVTNETKNSPKFVFEVKNNSINNLQVGVQYGILFPSVQSDDNSTRIQPDWEITDRTRGRYASIIFPGETLKLTMSMMGDNIWEMNTVPKLWMKIQHNSDSGNLKILEMYSVPIPYTYTEGN
jgi:hypothetical protein